VAGTESCCGSRISTVPTIGSRATLFQYVARGWLPLLGPPDAYFSTCNHDDAATAVVTALNLASGIYNVVDNEPMTHRQFGEVLAAIVGVPMPKTPPQWLVPLTGGLGETMARSLRISNAKLRQMGGWAPKYATSREGWAAVCQSSSIGAIMRPPHARGGGRKEQAS